MGCIQEDDWPNMDAVDDARLSAALFSGVAMIDSGDNCQCIFTSNDQIRCHCIPPGTDPKDVRSRSLERYRLEREDYLEEICIGVGP
jgi:hypothetical protein